MQLFRPTRGGPRQRPKKGSVRTWTGHFFCMADRMATKPPLTSEKLALQNAGLGFKKIQFQEIDTEETVFAKLTSIDGFPLLKDVGGFELLHCQSNCRELQIISCPWSVEFLKKVIGTQAKIYIRPIQKNIKVINITEEGPSTLKESCSTCHKLFSITELRDHVNQCSEVDEGYLPDLDIQADVDFESITTAFNEVSTPTLLETSVVPNTPDNTFATAMFESAETHAELEVESVNNSSAPNLNSSAIENQTTLGQSISNIVESTVQYCTQNGIFDPTEILRYFQKKIVTGRKLDIVDETNLLEGKTNFILVDRNRIIESSFEEIKAIEDLRTCLEVQFYGEVIFLVKK